MTAMCIEPLLVVGALTAKEFFRPFAQAFDGVCEETIPVPQETWQETSYIREGLVQVIGHQLRAVKINARLSRDDGRGVPIESINFTMLIGMEEA